MKNKRILGISIGFSLVILIMTTVIVFGMSRLAQMQEVLRKEVGQEHKKEELVFAMREGMLKRIISLRNIFVASDVFEIDEERLRFYGYASEVVAARDQLLAMELGENEKKALDKFLEAAKVGTPIQNEIVDLAIEGKKPAELEPLFKEAFAAQEAALQELTEFLESLQLEHERILVGISESYEATRISMMLLTVIAVVIALITSVYVTRWNYRQTYLIEDEREKFKTLFSDNLDAVIIMDGDEIREWNARAKQLFHLNKGGLAGKHMEELSPKVQESGTASREAWQQQLTQALARGGHRFEWLFQEPDESVFYADISLSVINLRRGRFIQALIRDITERKYLEHRMQYQAAHDNLTGLINRREFEKRVQLALDNAKSEDKTHVLCYLDLDRFKYVNDTAGHAAGDELLKQLVEQIKPNIRSSDVLARLGGDEFGLLLLDCDQKKAKSIAESLRATIEAFEFIWEHNTFHVSVSIGIVPVTSRCSSLKEVLESVDAACYAAKNKGRNQVYYSTIDDPAMALRTGERPWIDRLQDAIEHDNFSLYCQTANKVLNSDQSEIYAEILIRMQEPGKEPILPSAFFPTAERYQLMPAIDQWAIRHGILAVTSGKSILDKHKTVVAFNVSSQFLMDSNSLAFLRKQISEATMDPGNICFEIEEPVAVANLVRTMEFVSEIKKLGCRCALDDFGSSVRSFAYLKNLKMDYLKIEGNLVKGALDDPTSRIMVEASNQLGHSLKMKTIAKFVDNDETITLLKQIHVDLAQGFGVSKVWPLLADS